MDEETVKKVEVTESQKALANDILTAVGCSDADAAAPWVPFQVTSGMPTKREAVATLLALHDVKPGSDRSGMKYPGNVLNAFEAGAQLDLRVRMAMDLLRSSPIFHGLAVATPAARYEELPKAAAALALNIADELMLAGENLGLVTPLPDDDDTSIPASLRAQALRVMRFNVVQQLAGPKIQQEEQGRIIPVAPVTPIRPKPH